MIDYNSAAHCQTGRSIAANLFRQQRIPYVVHSHRAYTSTVNPMYCVDLGLRLYAEIRTEFVSNVDQSQTRCQLSVIIVRVRWFPCGTYVNFYGLAMVAIQGLTWVNF